MATIKNTTITSTGGLDLPVGTQANRPGSPANGMIRYSTDSGFELYQSGAWVNNRSGLTQATAILDFEGVTPFNGPAWINPALALGTGDNPILVNCEIGSDGNTYVVLETTFTNGIVSNQYSTTNCVDKVRSEGPNGSSSYIGQYFGLGNVDIAYAGNSGSAVGRSTTYEMGSDSSRRQYVTVTYRNPATGSNLSSTEAEQIGRWANDMDPNCYQIVVETDDDNAGWESAGNTVFYSGTNDQPSTNYSVGHPVGLHSWDNTTGTVYGYDGTQTGGGHASNAGQIFILTRSRYSSNAVIATRWNVDTQDQFAESGASLGGNVTRDQLSQSETLNADFILPRALSLMIHTGGGNAWAYMTYVSGTPTNKIMIRGANV